MSKEFRPIFWPLNAENRLQFQAIVFPALEQVTSDNQRR
jgi:hypothetical protein